MTQPTTETYSDGLQAQPEQPLTARQARRAEAKQAKADAKAYKRQLARQNGSRALLIRRIIVLTVLAAMLATIVYVLFYTTVADPVLAMIAPIKDGIAWVREDPKRIFMAAATLIIPHMGMYTMLTRDER